MVAVSKPVSSYALSVKRIALDVLIFPSDCSQRIGESLTDVNGRCNRQGHQGFILHDQVFAGCHGDEVSHPICFGYSVDDFLSKREKREKQPLEEMGLHTVCMVCVRACVGLCVCVHTHVCVSHRSTTVSNKGSQEPVCLSPDPCMVPCLTPLHDPRQQNLIFAQHCSCLL